MFVLNILKESDQFMEQKCYQCGAPLTGKKCDYCGAKNKIIKKQVNQQYDSSEGSVLAPIWQKIIAISGGAAVLIFAVSIIFSQLNPTTTSEYRYVCHNAPTWTTAAPDVTTVTTVETYGTRIVRWIEQDTFLRQSYIDHYWAVGWDLSDDDIREWFEGPFNVMEMDGTYWELVSLDENYVITNFIFDYENMSRADLDQLWDPNFSGVNRHTAIRVLEEQGAVCVRE